jgi:hypothetical protein
MNEKLKPLKINSMKTLPVISIGVVNIPSGMTQYDWSIYENIGLFAFLTDSGYLIFGAEGSLKVGDEYDLVGNDSRRRLSRNGSIISICSCEDKVVFTQWLKSHKYDYTPIRAFKSRSASNRKLTTSYVLK